MDNDLTKNIKKRLQKINLLFNIFEKEGLESLSIVEKSLLLEQIELLKKAVSEIEEDKNKIIGMKLPKEETISIEVSDTKIIDQKSINYESDIIEDSKKMNTEVESNSKPNEIIPKSSSNQLRNMRDVIDLNRSFIFKSELFNNDLEAYNNFIDKLNTQVNEDDAINLVDEYAKIKSWDKEDKVFGLLLRTVEKRFLPLLG